MKYVSYSLYGNAYNSMYVLGAFANANLVRKYYPDWKMIVFHDNSVTGWVENKLHSMDVDTINIEGKGILAAGWRFLVYDLEECERFIIRDTDSRITPREVEAVTEWEKEDTILHTMRDHPSHYSPIMGGMWGMKKNNILKSMEDAILDFQGKKFNSKDCCDRSIWWNQDQQFLTHVIKPLFLNEHDSTCHAAGDFTNPLNQHRITSIDYWSKPFPTPLNQKRGFIGEKFHGSIDENWNWTGQRFQDFKRR